MVVKYSGIAGARGYNPTKIVLHNDEGSQNANSAFYKRWLETHDPEKGFAHYYVADDGTYQAELEGNRAWHCGNTVGNRDYIGIEICQSKGNAATFEANEQRAFKLSYDLCKKYGIAIVPENFPLHKELSATSCPRRSLELHGSSTKALKQYFVDQVLKAGGETVKPPVQKPSNPQPSKKSVETIAKEVIDGKWSSGQDRINRLTKAGYNAQEVQNKVNQLLGAKPTAPKPSKPKLLAANVIRDQVIAGKWGSGQDRIDRLNKAGYNAKTVQEDVNKKLTGANKPKPKKSNQQVAREIFLGQGGWGNGATRIAKLKAAGYNPDVVQALVNRMI